MRSQCCLATVKLSLEDAIPLVIKVSSTDPTLSPGGARGLGLSHRVSGRTTVETSGILFATRKWQRD